MSMDPDLLSAAATFDPSALTATATKYPLAASGCTGSSFPVLKSHSSRGTAVARIESSPLNAKLTAAEPAVVLNCPGATGRWDRVSQALMDPSSVLLTTYAPSVLNATFNGFPRWPWSSAVSEGWAVRALSSADRPCTVASDRFASTASSRPKSRRPAFTALI